ncbi:MAG: spore maturation protein A [Oscillospiraceae bacterium]|nr:spore maturation protein A [Oscillospiraceae bacterium]
MAMGYVWSALMGASLLFALWTGSGTAVGTAAMDASAEAVTLGVKLLGPIMLWSAVMELMSRSGLTNGLGKLFAPLLRRLFPSARRDPALLGELSLNVSANLLGLGNAATPAGIRAAKGLRERELSRLVVLNTASLQLLPTTVAALRASLGSAAPYDLLPAVWLSSAVSVCVGLGVLRLLERWS